MPCCNPVRTCHPWGSWTGSCSTKWRTAGVSSKGPPPGALGQGTPSPRSGLTGAPGQVVDVEEADKADHLEVVVDIPRQPVHRPFEHVSNWRLWERACQAFRSVSAAIPGKEALLTGEYRCRTVCHHQGAFGTRSSQAIQRKLKSPSSKEVKG